MPQDDWRVPEDGAGEASPSPRREADEPDRNPYAPPSGPPPLPSAGSGEATQPQTPPTAEYRTPSYGSPPAYGTPPAHAMPPVYGTPPPHGTLPPYGSPPAPATPPVYGTPPGYPQGQGYGYVRSRTSGFAIASFVLSLVWMFWLGSVLAVIFGHIALSEIKRDPSVRGRGLAIAGLVIGYVALGLVVLGLLASYATRSSSTGV